MSDAHNVEFLRNAAKALAGMHNAQNTDTQPPRLVWLERVAAIAASHQEIIEILKALPAPVQGWWQTADHFVVATPMANCPATGSADWAQLLEGEWTAGPQTIQVKRVSNVLRLARMVEHAQPHAGTQPTLATDHTQVPRQDLARTMAVTTYAQWSDAQAQIVPVAQRLKDLQPLQLQNTTAKDIA